MDHTLPIYKHPQVWVVLTKIPLAPSGKVDEEELIRLSREVGPKSNCEVTVEDSVSSIERQIMDIFSIVLGRTVSQYELATRFVDMGGDSLCYIELVDKLAHAFILERDHESFTHICMESFDEFSIGCAYKYLRRFTEK